MGPTDDERDNPADKPGGEEPTRELPGVPTGASEDRCGACGAPLVHDQRYCVECGERRGQSRFPVTQPPAPVAKRRTRAAPAARPPRMSSGTTLVAGIGVLLLAIGLGVLIGRVGTKTTTTQAAATTPQVITVQGGGGGSTPTTTTSSTTTTPKSKKAKAAVTTKAPSQAVQKKATQAAGKVLGNSAHLAPPTVTNGQTCTGAGCQGGKFTGNFFGQ